MRVVGIRAEPGGFTWAVTEGTLETPVLVEAGHFSMPSTYSFSDGANFLRSKLIQLMATHRIEAVGLRTPETMPRTTESLRERIRVEGALLAACGEVSIPASYGPLATLSKQLGVKSAKAIIESGEYLGIDLETMPKERREAILMSASLLKAEDDN